MKPSVLLAVLFGVLCVTYAVSSSSSKKETRIRTARNIAAERQNDEVKGALAQLYRRLMENEIKQQDFSDADRAEIESIASKIRNLFHGLGNKIKSGFTKLGGKIKKAFHKG